MTTKTSTTELDSTQLARTEHLAKKTAIVVIADVMGLGASVQKSIAIQDPEVDKVLMKDLGPVGDMFIQMQGGMSSLKPSETLSMKPTWIDTFVEKFAFLRSHFGILARFIKQYETVSAFVKDMSSKIRGELSGLIVDVTSKEASIALYMEYEIELLVWARVGELKLRELENTKKRLEGKQRGSSEDQQLTGLKSLIQILSQRINNLRTASMLTKQAWVQLETSKTAEWSLIEKTDAGLNFNEAAWRQAARAVVSALRMCKAADLVDRIQEYTEVILLESAQLQKKASLQSSDVGSRAIASLALMQQVNELAIETITEQNAVFINSRQAMKEADLAMVDLRKQLKAALVS